MADDLTLPALILNGLAVRVVDTTWSRKKSSYLGARVRTAQGNRGIDTSRDEVRIFECAIDVYDQADEDAARAACPQGQVLAASGMLLPEAMDVFVDIGDTQTATWTIDGEETVLRTVTLHIEEARNRLFVP